MAEVVSAMESINPLRGLQADRRFRRIQRWSYGDVAAEGCLVHGDNLAVMRALSEISAEAFRCIYLDPPYNNGDTYEHYADRMPHEEWLFSVLERLKVAYSLLTQDGCVWISIDDSEMHYLKVAADSVFGRHNFVGTVVWERRVSRENRRVLSRNHEYLLLYAKSLDKWGENRNSLPITEEVRGRYKNPDNDFRGPWQSVTATAQDGHATPQQYYVIRSPGGKVHKPPKGRCWVYSEDRMKKEIKDNNVWFGRDGNGAPRLKRFLKDREGGLTPETMWPAVDVKTTADAKKHLMTIFEEKSIFDTPKPEELIARILQISTDPGDLVLDPYLGSGTTAAVAHKMGRRYIGLEIGNHIKTHCAYRLKKTVQGEAGGISKQLDWPGGGAFDFYRYCPR